MSFAHTLSSSLDEEISIFVGARGNNVAAAEVPGSVFVNPLPDDHLATKVEIYLEKLIEMRDLTDRMKFVMDVSKSVGPSGSAIAESFANVAKLSRNMTEVCEALAVQRAQLNAIPVEEINAALTEMGYINPNFDFLSTTANKHNRPVRVAEVVIPAGAQINLERDDYDNDCIHVTIHVADTETYFTLDEAQVDVNWINTLPRDRSFDL